MSLPFEVTPEQTRTALQAGDAVLVDVRRREEWEELRIPGAVLVPLDELAESLEDIPHDRDVYIHCRSGIRSARAVEFLRSTGRERTANVAGGIEAWQAAGLPVE